MANISNLNTFLTDVADAIRTKKGSTAPIVARNMDSEILSISTYVPSDTTKYAPRKVSFYNYKGSELNLELNALDTTQITDFSYMFNGCNNLTVLDVSNFNTENATNMSYMFRQCLYLQSLDVSNFKTNNVTNMSYMFGNLERCTSLTFGDTFDTSNVTNMNAMIASCCMLTSLDLSSFNTEKVTNMSQMFVNLYEMTSLDLSSFYTPALTNMMQMFFNCSALQHLDIRNFTFDNVTSYSNAFMYVPTDCEIIVKDDAAKTWLTSKFPDMTNIKTVAEYEGV